MANKVSPTNGQQYPSPQYRNQYPPEQYPSQYHQSQYPQPQNSWQYRQQPGQAFVVVEASRQVYQPAAVEPQPAGCCACCIVPDYCGLIALSCFVFWCCGWILGLIAFILARK